MKAKAKLETLNSNIESKYTNGSYFVIGGSVQFKTDMKSLERKYNQYVNLGPKAKIVLEEYKKNQLSKIQIIRDRENAIEAANQRDEEMIERNRLVNQMNQDREEHNLMIRWQEELQDRRNEENDILLSNIVSGVLRIGFWFVFDRFTR